MAEESLGRSLMCAVKRRVLASAEEEPSYHIISKTSWLWPRERECRALYETFLDISSLSLIQCSQSNCACRMLPPRNFQWNHLICFDLNCDKNGSHGQHWSHVGAAFACNIDSLTATLSGDDFQCCLENNIFILDSLCVMLLLCFFFGTLSTLPQSAKHARSLWLRCRSEYISCCLSHVLNFDANEHGFWSLRLRNWKTE